MTAIDKNTDIYASIDTLPMPRPLTFLDVNTFYCPNGGGIRTYHQAKIAYFRQQRHHRYILAYPGPSRRRDVLSDHVSLARLVGWPMRRDPEGYHVLLDVFGYRALLREIDPDVVEAGEPWLASPLALLGRRLGWNQAMLTSFYHSDPVRTYLEPWLADSKRPVLKKPIVDVAAKTLQAMQRAFALTLTSSETMSAWLQREGAPTQLTPFGASEVFFADPIAARPAAPPHRILYAGRLDDDKGMDVLIAGLPRLLLRDDVTVTVVGRGKHQPFFESFAHPRFRYGGHVATADGLRAVMDQHHLLLAPGPYETFGLVILEAMATGLPVIGPDRGGAAEMLQKTNQPLIFRTGDVDHFIAMVDEALSMPYEPLSQQARAVAAHYGTWHHAIDRMVKAYEAKLG